jgi:hypothetical protein
MGAGLAKALELVGAGEEWKQMPWQVWKPPSEIWERMPTFVLTEWGYRAGSLVAWYHAIKTGRRKSLAAAVICGTANDIFFMFMPFCDNFWQGQASIMITPRLPLYIVEMYACVMYYAPVAASLFARSTGMNPVGQACLTGLLAHLYYGVYDVNGPRYLWWTWHDGDPAISERQCNAPLGSSLWILTYCSLQSLLNSWILRAPGARLTGVCAPSPFDMSATPAIAALVKQLVPASYAGSTPVQLLQTAGRVLDQLQVALGRSGDSMQILFRAIVATPVFMVMMGQLSFFSLDKLGIPGQRTYKFTLTLMIGTVVQQLIAGRNRTPSPPLPESFRGANRLFSAAVLGHFALHTLINIYGTPETAASTGIHQDIRPAEKVATVKDIMGWPREEELHPGGPTKHSVHDYSFQPVEGEEKPEDAIEPLPEGPQALWYTVYGKKHKDKAGEFRAGAILATLGTIAFSIAMRKEV